MAKCAAELAVLAPALVPVYTVKICLVILQVFNTLVLDPLVSYAQCVW